MKQLAFIMEGHSGYEDRLYKLLGEARYKSPTHSQLDRFDYSEYFSLMIIAGASIRNEKTPIGDGEESEDYHFIVEVEEDREEKFYNSLESILKNN